MATLNITIPDADETTKGIAEVSTQAEVDTGTDDERIITPLKLANSALRGEVTANNAKVTNATHTGEVTGSGALTVDKTAISNKTLVTAEAGDHVLIGDASDSDNLKKVNVSDFLGGGSNSMEFSFFFLTNKNMADSQDYFFGQNQATGSNENQTLMVPIPAGTITDVLITKYVGSTFPSNEAMTLNFVSDVGGTDQVDLITNTLSYQTALPRNAYEEVTGLSISVLQGMSYFKLTTPVWATNPISAGFRITIIIEPS